MAAALASVVLCGACASAPALVPASSQNLNVSGTLNRGPVATCPADEPCDPPAAASALVFSRDGATPVNVRVAPDGTFALHLDPGDYSIGTAPPVFHAAVEPSSVHVPDSGSVVLQLRLVGPS